LNAEGVRQFQPRVGTTLGANKEQNQTLKALANQAQQVANTFSVANSKYCDYPGLSQAPTLG
jgi:hypothetical protein